ncbi:MAG: ABC transporter ATP-binding protein [Burkholderiales bacterium]
MIKIQQLKKEFPAKEGVFTALHSIDLEVARGEFFVLLGPSGSGKSTLLRCVAGIDIPQGGEMSLDDRLIYSAANKVFVRPEDRGLGMVFQSYAVWPHMTVYQNVALPLTHGTRKIAATRVRERVMHALSQVQMETFADRPVPYLSGGQQQRVALARALAVEPVVLLMDEPLSNLDARLREEVRHQILSVTKRVGVTVLYVTHDQTEALALGDRVAVMHQGRILQIAPPNDLFSRPANDIVADFLGKVNWIEGQVASPGEIDSAIGKIHADTGQHQGKLRIGIRPSSLQVSLARTGETNEFNATVTAEAFLGEQIELQLMLAGGTTFELHAPRRAHVRWLGKEVYCRVDASEILVYPV